MARQMGSRIQFLLKAESAYGTLPSGNWEKVPILDFDPGTGNDIQDDPAIGFGHRESLDVMRGPIVYKPKVTVPVDLNNIGYWLKALFGSYAVSGSSVYTHVFKANALSVLPSLALELGNPDANAGAGVYFDYPGFCIDSGAFDLTPTGPAKLVLNGVAKNEAKNTSSQGGTPAQQTYTPFSNIQGTLQIDTVGSTAPASNIGNVIGASINIANNIDARPGVATAGLILGADAGQQKITGDITVRFDSTTLYDDAIAATNVALSMGYTIDNNNLLNIVLPRVALGRAGAVVSGPAGVQMKFPFQAQRDTSSGAAIIATLMNAVAAY